LQLHVDEDESTTDPVTTVSLSFKALLPMIQAHETSIASINIAAISQDSKKGEVFTVLRGREV
jgi:hypothetical protein